MFKIFCSHLWYLVLGSRVVNIWSSLPDYVVEDDSRNAFKNRLDKYWTNQDVTYDYKSDLMLCYLRCGQRGFPAPVTSHWIGLDGLVGLCKNLSLIRAMALFICDS